MEIGNDDLDEFYEDEIINDTIDNTTDDSTSQDIEDPSELDSDDRAIISLFLTGIGINDMTKIKFVDDEDLELEISWDELDSEEKLNILRTNRSDGPELDDSEIELLNTIRSSKMSPSEYINYMQQLGAMQYAQNIQGNTTSYSVDDLSDDDIFVADLLTRMGEDNITNEEATHLLELAKQNENLFKKQVDSIRNEYKSIEDRNRLQEQEMKQQEEIQKYNRFAESVENEIRAFTNIAGYDLNMDESEMEELYDFITGFDQANVSVFGKVLNDPKSLVKMAWFALNGEQAIQDINNYWTNEIKKISRANKKETSGGSKVAFKKNTSKPYFNDDID